MKIRNPPFWGMNQPKDDSDKPKDETQTNGKEAAGSFKVEGLRIYFYRDIYSDSVVDLVSKLKELEIKSLSQAVELELDAPQPIHLHIHSYGGSVFSGLAAMDAIKRCKVPVHTYIEGAAASAATFLSVAGTKRFIGTNGYILIHQLSNFFWGKYEEWKDEMKNNDLLMEKIKAIYREHTKLGDEQLEELLKHDLWLPADKALEYGLVDAVE